jgi:hypothetical protein
LPTSNNMTLAKIASIVRLITNTNSVTFSDANLYVTASERQKQVLKTITDLKEGYLETTNSQDLAAGTQGYTVPATGAALRIKRAEVLYATGGSWRKVTFFDMNERGATNDSTTIAGDFSQSSPYGDMSGDKLMLYPIPDANVTNGLKVWYIAVPADFTATSDTPVIPGEFHRLLADLVAVDVRQMKGEISAIQAVQEEQVLLQFLKSQVSPRVTDHDQLKKPLRINYE